MIVAAYAAWRALRMREQFLILCVGCLCFIFVISALISSIFLNSPEPTDFFFQNVLLWSRAAPEILLSWIQISIDGIKVFGNVGFAIAYFLAASVALLAWNGFFSLLFPRRRVE